MRPGVKCGCRACLYRAYREDYFRLEQFFAGQVSQFSMASISKPWGTNSPHEQLHPSGRASVRGFLQNGHIRSPRGVGLI